MIRVS
jgi:hypothetical protein